MNRFEKKNLSFRLPGKLLSAVFFVILLFVFLFGLSSVSDITQEKELESLEDSVRKSAVHCYALEGFYPESLSYLEEHYGIRYNKEKYMVSYEIIGSNLMPDIRVILLNTREDAKP